MSTAKKKTAGARAMIDEFSKGFSKAMKDEHDEHEAMPKAHDVEKGEFVAEVDPAKADKHLED